MLPSLRSRDCRATVDSDRDWDCENCRQVVLLLEGNVDGTHVGIAVGLPLSWSGSHQRNHLRKCAVL